MPRRTDRLRIEYTPRIGDTWLIFRATRHTTVTVKDIYPTRILLDAGKVTFTVPANVTPMDPLDYMNNEYHWFPINVKKKRKEPALKNRYKRILVNNVDRFVTLTSTLKHQGDFLRANRVLDQLIEQTTVILDHFTP